MGVKQLANELFFFRLAGATALTCEQFNFAINHRFSLDDHPDFR